MTSIIPLLLLLLALGLVAATAGIIRHWWLKKQLAEGHISELPSVQEGAEMGCCGDHELCEKDSLLVAVSEGKIEYFEDEDLDRFQGREGNEYSAAEVEEFEDVLSTLRSEEVAPWVRSLQLRGLALPDALKDEVILLVGERRWAV